jgi:hypothetical protein
MFKRCVLIAGIVALVALTGCSTTGSGGTGDYRTYNKSTDVVWAATLEVLDGLPISVIAKDKSSGTIIAEGELASYGADQKMKVYVEEDTTPGSTRVKVVSKATMSPNNSAPPWPATIFKALDKKLGS